MVSDRPALSEIEVALRYLGTRDHGVLVDLLEHAVNRPSSTTGTHLIPLTAPTSVLADWTAAERAGAIWQLIKEGIRDPDVAPTSTSRRRRALQAAFRLPDAEIRDSWRGSLTERFKQLKTLTLVFNSPTSTQPMEMAWKSGVRLLARFLADRFAELQSPSSWERYRPAANGGIAGDVEELEQLPGGYSGFRSPSTGAQPFFVDLFVTTVFMRRRSVYRRITERLVTARADGVEYYSARGSIVSRETDTTTYVPVRALWGCQAEFVGPLRVGRPVVTRLRFPEPLRLNQQAHFASEALFDDSEDRDWINVNIDHHGIAPGRLMFNRQLPVSGLTIRVRFDENDLPEMVWWYAELNESERYDPPPRGDTRFLRLVGPDVQHTFTGLACQPRENYGISFAWPS